MTFADDLASHISTNWSGAVTAAGLIDSYTDQPEAAYADNAGLDVILVLEANPHHRLDPLGTTHQHETITWQVHLWARTTADLKARLVVMVNEARHVCHSNNHALTGYSWHRPVHAEYHLDKRTLNEPSAKRGPEAKAVILVEGYKNGRGV